MLLQLLHWAKSLHLHWQQLSLFDARVRDALLLATLSRRHHLGADRLWLALAWLLLLLHFWELVPTLLSPPINLGIECFGRSEAECECKFQVHAECECECGPRCIWV